MISLLIVWTIAGICFTKHKNAWRVLNGMIAVFSFVAVLYFTIIDRTADGTHQMPFIRTIEHIKAQPELIREMIMNAFLFFPFGLTMPYAIGSNKITENNRKKYLPVLITIVTAFLLSISIELIQHLYNFGNAELSDIIMNTLGAAIGSASYCISQKLLN